MQKIKGPEEDEMTSRGSHRQETGLELGLKV